MRQSKKVQGIPLQDEHQTWKGPLTPGEKKHLCQKKAKKDSSKTENTVGFLTAGSAGTRSPRILLPPELRYPTPAGKRK